MPAALSFFAMPTLSPSHVQTFGAPSRRSTSGRVFAFSANVFTSPRDCASAR